MICVYPLVLWSILGILSLLTGRSTSLTNSWRLLALPLAVIVSAGHMAKGLAKFTSWISFLPYAVKDPSGIKTASEITSKIISQPAPILFMPFVSIIGIMLIIAGTYFGIREARLANPETYRQRLVPKFMVSILFIFIIAGWEFFV